MMNFWIIITILFAILLGVHWALYASIVSFFAIADKVCKRTLAGVLAFLSVSFILAWVLVSRQENLFTRGFYLMSGYWLGLLVNLLMALAVVWLIVGLSRLTGLRLETAMIALICFGLASAYTAYGVWNAEHPRIKNITVTIPNLPAQWKNKKIVQLSDVHLGHVRSDGFLRHIVAEVNAVHPALVVITGDLFDGSDGELRRFVQPLNGIQAEKGMFFITGNHETYLGVEKAFAALENTPVRILQDEIVDVDGLKVIGISYPKRGENKDVVGVLHSLEKDFGGRPNLFLYHAPVHINEFKDSGVNLQLSGHTHMGQIFPFRYITHLVYKGYDYGLHRMGDYTLYTTDGIGTWGPALRTGNTPEIVVVTLQ